MKIINIIKLLIIIAILYLIFTTFLNKKNIQTTKENNTETYVNDSNKELLNYLDSEISKLKKLS